MEILSINSVDEKKKSMGKEIYCVIKICGSNDIIIRLKDIIISFCILYLSGDKIISLGVT